MGLVSFLCLKIYFDFTGGLVIMKQNLITTMKQYRKSILFKRLLAIGTISFTLVMSPIIVSANTQAPHQTHGWGRGEGRYQPVNINDFHTASWYRFGPFNYSFRSGPDFDHIFGSHTHVTFFTPDTSMQNIRRDRHASDRPLPYGVFSSITPTPLINPSFQQSLQRTNQQQPFIFQSPNPTSSFNTAFIGSSSQNIMPTGQSQSNFTGHSSAWGASSWNTGVGLASPHTPITQGAGAFLMPTSIID